MFLLLIAPVVAVVAAAHRLLQLYAPSNLIAAHVRRQRPELRTAGWLIVLAVALLIVGRALSESVADGGPGWLNLIFLITVWDASKFIFLAILVTVRRARVAVREITRHRTSACHRARPRSDQLTEGAIRTLAWMFGCEDRESLERAR
jgi:hypothetical protein